MMEILIGRLVNIISSVWHRTDSSLSSLGFELICFLCSLMFSSALASIVYSRAWNLRKRISVRSSCFHQSSFVCSSVLGRLDRSETHTLWQYFRTQPLIAIPRITLSTFDHRRFPLSASTLLRIIFSLSGVKLESGLLLFISVTYRKLIENLHNKNRRPHTSVHTVARSLALLYVTRFLIYECFLK